MNIVEAYTRAWLTLLLFRVDTPIYEDSWNEVCRLESSHRFSQTELAIMRRFAQERWRTAILPQ